MDETHESVILFPQNNLVRVRKNAVLLATCDSQSCVLEIFSRAIPLNVLCDNIQDGKLIFSKGLTVEQ